MSLTLRVATWNIHEGMPVTDDAGRGDLSAALAEAGVQVAALQEVTLDADGNSDDLAAVADSTPLRHMVSFPLSESVYSPGRCMGVALVSSYPLTNPRSVRLPNPGLRKEFNGSILSIHDKGFVAAQLDWSGPPVWVASLHSYPFYLFGRDPGEMEFVPIWKTLATEIESLAKEPTILGGDFNTGGRVLLTRWMSPQRIYWAINRVPTYDKVAADDILCTIDFALRGAEVRPTFSDHAMCVSEFELVERD
jgi:endonuclease/exonuclease/phosphatase family metal-dependent hydrolase